jgi:hypothetical protein
MSTGTVAAIVIVVIVVAALIAVAAFVARRRRLQRTFGPEYDRAVQSSDSRLRAEAELAERQKRVKHLDIRRLDPAARNRYAAQWIEIQQQFVDSPATAVTGAQTLITSVMRDEGYPTEDDDQVMADLSVEYATTVEHFRTAQDLSNRASGGTASTEDLRQAMVHYRELFRELLGGPAGGSGDRAAGDDRGTDVRGTDAAATNVPARAPATADVPARAPATTDVPGTAPAATAPASTADTTSRADTTGGEMPATAAAARTANVAALPSDADESVVDPPRDTVPDEPIPATASRFGRRR